MYELERLYYDVLGEYLQGKTHNYRKFYDVFKTPIDHFRTLHLANRLH